MKGMMTKAQRQEAIRKLQGIKNFPATRVSPITVTMEEFLVACEQCQQRAGGGHRDQNRYRFTLCDICQGVMLPKEVTAESMEAGLAKRRRPENAGTFPGQGRRETRSMPRQQDTF
jgi:hypothetical protein